MDFIYYHLSHMYAAKIKLAIGTFMLSLTACAATITIPVGAKKHLPEVKVAIGKTWPTLSTPSLIGGQIEQESCITLTHPRCWNPNVELKTPTEYGFGLGQLTISYDKKGNVRFDNFQEAKRRFGGSLSAWKWEDRFNPTYQISTIILMDKNLYNRSLSLTPYEQDRLAFMLSGYNGGFGGVLQDRKLCQGIVGCDPSKWFGNVAAHSYKSRIKVKGYGEAAFDINRGYVDKVLNQRRQKYIPFLETSLDDNNKGP